MKKRLLSFLLAAMMVVAMAMPFTANAADAQTYYSWDGFADNDVRTHKASEGQVIDLGIKGPVSKAPVVDGTVDTNEYNKTATLLHLSNKSKTVEAYFATHGGYLYVAVDVTGAGVDPSTRSTVQFDIGVATAPTSENTWNRLGLTIGADGVLQASRSGFFQFVGEPTAYATGYCAVKNADYIVEHSFDFGVYEIKVDLGNLYKLFANQPGGTDAWETPTLNFSFWELTSGENHYCVPASYQNVGRSVNWLSYCVIIPEATFDYIKSTHRGVVGALGTDWRNLMEGQMVNVPTYATTAPTIDGVVDPAEYTASGVFTQDMSANYATDFTLSYSVKDGWVYCAIQYESAAPTTGLPLQFGLNSNTGTMVWGRLSGTINTNGTFTGPGGMYKDIDYTWEESEGNDVNGDGKIANTTNNWISGAFNGAGWAAAQPVDKSALQNVDNVTTIEFRASIAAMITAVEQSGYNPSEANCFKVMFFPDGNKQLSNSVDAAQRDSARLGSGWNHDPGYVCPTAALPKDCVETYRVTDVDDMEVYGQLHAQTKPGVATLDGVISAGEYTSSASWDSLRSSDGLMTPDITGKVSGTNYFTYDNNYFYFGAKVFDNNYVQGQSAFQLNLQVINKDDGKVDIGDGVTRISMRADVKADGTATIGAYGSVMRSQTCYDTKDDATKYAGQAEWQATFSGLKAEVAGSYDDATKTITYEIRVPLEHLKLIFGVEEVESVGFLHHVWFVDGGSTKGGWNLFKAPDEAAIRAIYAYSRAVLGSTSLKYNNNFFCHFVDFVDEPVTREGASVRLSTTISGLRFKSTYTNAYLERMASYAALMGEEMVVGTLIAPNDYVTAAGAFTHEALKARYGANGYVEVVAVQADPFQNVNGVTTFAGSLVNIKAGNLDRDFAGIGYIKVGNEYFYTDSYAVKNVSDVASAALADTKTAKQGTYKYEVSDGVWSPYTEGQRLILQNLVA